MSQRRGAGSPRSRRAAGRPAILTRARRVPAELAALLGVAAVLAVAWAVITVPLQGPDEPTHVSYAQQLAETGRGPAFDTGGGPFSTELGAALEQLKLRAVTGVSSARPARSEVEQAQWEDRTRTISEEQRQDGTGPSPLARNPQLYYAYESLPYLVAGDDLLDRLMAMRLANALLFVLSVLLTFLLAREVFGRDQRLRVTLATAVVALWPMLTFMAGVVNPDTALVTAYTAVLLTSVRLIRRGPSLARVVAPCACAAACLLVHGRGLASVAVVLAALVAALVSHRPPARLMAGWAAAGAAVALVPLVVSRLLLRPGTGGGLYGGEANLPAQTFSLRELFSQTWQFYLEPLSFMNSRLGPDYGYRQVVVERFAGGVFGTLEVEFPAWVYDVVQYAIVALVIGAWTVAVVHRDRLRRAWPVAVVLGTLVVALMALLHLASYRALANGSTDPLITGRYLLPLVPVVGLAIAWVVGALPRAARAWTAGAVLTALLALQLGGLAVTFLRFHV